MQGTSGDQNQPRRAEQDAPISLAGGILLVSGLAVSVFLVVPAIILIAFAGSLRYEKITDPGGPRGYPTWVELPPNVRVDSTCEDYSRRETAGGLPEGPANCVLLRGEGLPSVWDYKTDWATSDSRDQVLLSLVRLDPAKVTVYVLSRREKWGDNERIAYRSFQVTLGLTRQAGGDWQVGEVIGAADGNYIARPSELGDWLQPKPGMVVDPNNYFGGGTTIDLRPVLKLITGDADLRSTQHSPHGGSGKDGQAK